jgi:hypothetical protein
MPTRQKYDAVRSEKQGIQEVESPAADENVIRA